MKLSPEVKQIISAEADFVALVDHPASRLPFRIMKSEDGPATTLNTEGKSMSIDLGRIGQLLAKKAPAVPEITSFIISKGLSAEEADQLVADAGFDSSFTKADTADAYIYTVAPAKDGDAVIQLTDDVAITVANLSKAFYDFDYQSSSFDLVNATTGFYPSLYRGLSALENTVSNILNKSATAGEAKPQIRTALDDFTRYATMIVESLPEQAFKAEELAKSADMKKKKKKGDKDEEDLKKADLSGITRPVNGTSGIAQAPMSSEADRPQEGRTESPEPRRVSPDPGHRAQTHTDSAETGPAETQTPKANQQAAEHATGDNAYKNTNRDIDAERSPTAPRDSHVAEATTQVAAENREEKANGTEPSTNKDDPEQGLLAKMTELLSPLTQTVQALQNTMGDMDQRLRKSEQVLSGTVAAPAPIENTPVRKSASAGAPPLLDTGLVPYRD